ncbi:hypothetical protein pEaSNUABM5_00207 [Erwinia phage pEa_SNUABM_5]|uniref:Uncharacterized protein n=1 Tax=Erwinia phage pEa_SNUABM_5 TaxID=2797313 RepID=A0A7T8IW87_9CAUD|nr:hypothetical protein MPK73_gp207 [Erwinia phage pEa_SNUABM_5]QQO90349.1 hypothetical protein pEaSNUABM5_00207 [Erwinia phage pEa_SNUABM_5]
MHFKPHPAFQICRYVQDIDPYTNEPVSELEVIKETFAPVTEQTLQEYQARYGANVWVQPTTIWS